jgi:seryl-tRNA synthetase
MSTLSESERERKFLDELVAAGCFIPSGEAGVYGRGSVFEDIRTRLDAFISRIAARDDAEQLRFPPIISKRTLEKAGYLKSFPNLCGAIYSFKGNEAAALDLMERAHCGDDWSMHLTMTDVVLVPAACYPAYPAVALRGRLPKGGLRLDLGGSYVFRNEPSGNPARLQMFHQREMIRIGTAENVIEWREMWIDRAKCILDQLGLRAKMEIASDPFFGRGGKLLASSQRELGLKFEVLVPIASSEPTAVSSFNFHQDHFGSAFGIVLDDGSVANSACLGFGLERITLALIREHGFNPAKWPAAVREKLWVNATHESYALR